MAVRDTTKSRECELQGIAMGTDPESVAVAEDVDLVVELVGGASMLQPVTAALRRGVPVVTANKTLLAMHGAELARAAAEAKTTIRGEASAGGGIPVLQALDHGLRTENFQLLVAILNGTTNFILSTMERDGRDFAEALTAARPGFRRGRPHAGPLRPGHRAEARHPGSARLPHGRAAGIHSHRGDHRMELEDLRQADRFGYTVKLLGIALRHPEASTSAFTRRSSPSATFSPPCGTSSTGSTSAGGHRLDALLWKRSGRVSHRAGVLGRAGHGAELTSGAKLLGSPLPGDPERRLSLDRVRTKYYVRLTVEDRPGVLAQVTAALGSSNVSVAQIFQAEGVRGKPRSRSSPSDARPGRAPGGEGDRRAAVHATDAPRREDLRRMSATAWRGVVREFRDILPEIPEEAIVTLLEGGTPLVPTPGLARRLGPDVELFVKIEGQNPTGSFKDRGMTVAVSRAKARGAKISCARRREHVGVRRRTRRARG